MVSLEVFRQYIQGRIMANILIIFSTTDGHTRNICLRLEQIFQEKSLQVNLKSINEVTDQDFKICDKIVFGASVRYGKHAPQVYQFIENNRQKLEEKPNAFFSVNLVARKQDKNKPSTNPYLIKFLKNISWQPKTLAVFAGKVDYPRYRFFDRKMIQLIMWMTKGPTNSKQSVEFTNWQDVESFGYQVSTM